MLALTLVTTILTLVTTALRPALALVGRLAIVLLAVAGASVGSGWAQTSVLTNARIFTLNPQMPWAQSLAIDAGGQIVAVGSEAQVLSQAGDGAVLIDLEGMMVLPGFQDAHLHALEAGMNARRCLLEPFADLDDSLDAIADCVALSRTAWVQASGLNMPDLLLKDDNPRAVLDQITPRRPVLILDDIGHAALANTAALKAAGYMSLQGNPPGGLILRHPQTGLPNGVVLENAQQKLRNLAAETGEAAVQQAYQDLRTTLAKLAALGITSISDAGGYWPQGHVAVWNKALAEGTLTVRASNVLYVYPDLPFDQQMARLKALYSNPDGSLLRFNQAKIYVDGILQQRSGALLAPYRGHDQTLSLGEARGFLYFEQAALQAYAKALSRAGFQLHMHVTGDRGARLALDAIAQAAPGAGPHRLTHIYLLDPADYARFRALGVVADFQLAPSALDPDYLAELHDLLGARAESLMPAGALEALGAEVVMSSDYDADELSPLVKIQAAVQRPKNGAPNVETAIKWMTLNPARLLRHAEQTGSLEVGKAADLVVLERDITAIPVQQIGRVEVVATLLQGRPVFDPEGWFTQRGR